MKPLTIALKYNEPVIYLTYKTEQKTRLRKIPARGIKEEEVEDVLEITMKRHEQYLKQIDPEQLKRILRILQKQLNKNHGREKENINALFSAPAITKVSNQYMKEEPKNEISLVPEIPKKKSSFLADLPPLSLPTNSLSTKTSGVSLKTESSGRKISEIDSLVFQLETKESGVNLDDFVEQQYENDFDTIQEEAPENEEIPSEGNEEEINFDQTNEHLNDLF